jgi:hypothetical protein
MDSHEKPTFPSPDTSIHIVLRQDESVGCFRCCLAVLVAFCTLVTILVILAMSFA